MKKYIILIPLYNDWKSVSKLLEEIDLQISKCDVLISVLIVNDASTEERTLNKINFKNIKSVKIINMKENRGHQRCIAAGIKFLNEKEDFNHIIVMDADGEDRPEELVYFINKTEKNPNMTITGNRFKRSESLFFKVLYEIHKLITFIFTGKLIKFGNFSCVPKNHVKELVQKPYLWNSYSSSVVKAINDRTFIPSIRGVRYVYPSKMNFKALVFHSFSIISVFKDVVIIRSSIFFLIYLFFIFNSFSLLSFFPIFCLLFFVLTILKISNRSDIEGLNKSLDNIKSIEILETLITTKKL